MSERSAAHYDESFLPPGPLGVSEADARGMVMAFSPELPMFVPPRLYADLEKRGFLKDPEIAARIRKTPTIPLR